MNEESDVTLSEGMDVFDQEQAERLQWSLHGEYTGNDCPNCGRNRLVCCPNMKTRCEKCNWVVEDGEYCLVEL